MAPFFWCFSSLLPTLIYFASVYWLGDPVGNIDTGATIGSYIGLFLLGCIFAALGLFTSSLSDNQIIAFILGVFLCFVMFIAFDFLAEIRSLGGINSILIKLGIMEHYRSISRGVVDTRDLLYFFTVVAIALIATRIVLNVKRG